MARLAGFLAGVFKRDTKDAEPTTPSPGAYVWDDIYARLKLQWTGPASPQQQPPATPLTPVPQQRPGDRDPFALPSSADPPPPAERCRRGMRSHKRSSSTKWRSRSETPPPSKRRNVPREKEAESRDR